MRMSLHDFLLPDLGEGLTEAEIVDWKVVVGQRVEVDQPVAEVETAKAVIELPCPYAGRVTTLHGEPGEVLEVGSPLLTVELSVDETARTGGSRGRAGTVVAPSARPSAGILVGYGPGTDGGYAEVLLPNTPVISPVVRRLARQHGVETGSLRGTGPHGLISRADVLAAIDLDASKASPFGRDRVIPLTGRRRAVAEHLTRSRREIPDVTVWLETDATALMDALSEMNAGEPEPRMSVVALLAQACLSGLRRHPELNSRVDTARHQIVQSPDVHLGLAVQTDSALVVPVIRNAGRLGLPALAAAVAETIGEARAGRLPPQRLTGSTFTFNNYGIFGVDGATPIINHPEAAMLGLGLIAERPWVYERQLAIRKVVQITLTFDHRVCDGSVAASFLRHVADLIQEPALLRTEGA
jgi:pyruvate dehydrogenase E2 component (dihydrolipoamide acetyltransferase)